MFKHPQKLIFKLPTIQYSQGTSWQNYLLEKPHYLFKPPKINVQHPIAETRYLFPTKKESAIAVFNSRYGHTFCDTETLRLRFQILVRKNIQQINAAISDLKLTYNRRKRYSMSVRYNVAPIRPCVQELKMCEMRICVMTNPILHSKKQKRANFTFFCS